MKKKIVRVVAILLIAYILYSIIVSAIYSFKLLSNSTKFEGLVSNLQVYRYRAGGIPLSWENIEAQEEFLPELKYCPVTGEKFIYRGSDVSSEMPDALIIVYGNKPPANYFEKISIFTIFIGSRDDKIVALNNWNIEFMNEKEFEVAIKYDNKLRKELGLEVKQVE